MLTIFADTNRFNRSERGSALVIALIILAILSIVGFAALDIADLNIFMAANDRDAKEAFFRADSGVNIGRELIKYDLDDGNSNILETNAAQWEDSTNFSKDNYNFYSNSSKGIYVRAGLLALKFEGQDESQNEYSSNPGSGNPTPTFLIRSHAEGKRNSQAEVDIAWEDRPLN
jgi:Tfp pilus assembly protein PilX